MNFKRYEKLCEAMGAAKKAGLTNDYDFDQLEAAVEQLIGGFRDDAYAKVSALVHGNMPQIESRAAARDAINGLCKKYSVPLVCDPAETAQQTAAGLAVETVQLLCGENGIVERMETDPQNDKEKTAATPIIRLVKAGDGRTN